MEKENTELTPDELIEQKLRDVETPRYEVSFDPDEAEKIAFDEDALSDEDARDSVEDLSRQKRKADEHERFCEAAR